MAHCHHHQLAVWCDIMVLSVQPGQRWCSRRGGGGRGPHCCTRQRSAAAGAVGGRPRHLPGAAAPPAPSQHHQPRPQVLHLLHLASTCLMVLQFLYSHNRLLPTQLWLSHRLLEEAGLRLRSKTRVVVVGGRAGMEAVLLHHTFRNTAHALYLALHPPSDQSLQQPQQTNTSSPDSPQPTSGSGMLHRISRVVICGNKCGCNRHK